MSCTCSKINGINCLYCIYESTRNDLDKIMLETYENLIMNEWDGQRKFNRDELAIVRYCSERNLHPSN